MAFDLFKLILTIPFVFFLPGAFLLLAVFGWKNNEKISFFEKAALAAPLSLIVVDLTVLLINKTGVTIRGGILISAIAAFCLACFLVFQVRFKNRSVAGDNEKSQKTSELFDFSASQAAFIVVTLFLAVFIRSFYLADTIVPSATDLGHHMYWSQQIADTGRLSDYGMPDFIVGEHIVFAVVNLLSGIGLATAMPALLLLLANIGGIFVLAVLAARVFENRTVAAAVFLTAGVLYAISAPQGKYVSGGVVGNIFGNLLIPTSLYFLYRAIREKDSTFAGLFLLSFLGLLYTHHLSAYVLIYSIAAIVVAYLFLNIKKAGKTIADWIKVFLTPFPLLVLVFGIWFLVFVYTPSYFNPEAVVQAAGTPSKITRAGLNFQQLEMNAGSARLVLGALGSLLLLLGFQRKTYKFSFALAWLAVLFLMSAKPAWLYVNVPSNRVGNYLYLPLSLLAAYGLVEFLKFFRRSATQFFSAVLLFVLLFFVITNGLADSTEDFKVKNQFQEAIQTFHSARYLADRIDAGKDIVLKDHVNIYGDSWYKLFFMKDYKYPLSRGNLSRYVDPTKPREICTRDMIMIPETEAGKKCFSETGVNYLALNAQLEGNSFEKYAEFSKVYASNYIAVFKRN